LAGQAVARANDEDSEFGLGGGGGAAVDFVKGFAERAQAGAAERVAECGQGFGIGEGLAGGGAGVHQGFDMIGIEQGGGHSVFMRDFGRRVKRRAHLFG
jgi:hypothetical protein